MPITLDEIQSELTDAETAFRYGDNNRNPVSTSLMLDSYSYERPAAP
jgi:hypothetical protein